MSCLSDVVKGQLDALGLAFGCRDRLVTPDALAEGRGELPMFRCRSVTQTLTLKTPAHETRNS